MIARRLHEFKEALSDGKAERDENAVFVSVKCIHMHTCCICCVFIRIRNSIYLLIIFTAFNS